MRKRKKVLVSGCYDLLHAGHVAFLREAASFGRLFVTIGSDRNVGLLKGKPPYFSQEERLYIIKNISCVEDAWIGSGTGLLDFEPELRRIKADILVVNEDGHTEEKRAPLPEAQYRIQNLKKDPGRRAACARQLGHKKGTRLSFLASDKKIAGALKIKIRI